MSRRRRNSRRFSRRALVTMALIADDDEVQPLKGTPAPGIPVPTPRPSNEGFGAVALLVFLIPVALLALRRRKAP